MDKLSIFDNISSRFCKETNNSHSPRLGNNSTQRLWSLATSSKIKPVTISILSCHSCRLIDVVRRICQFRQRHFGVALGKLTSLLFGSNLIKSLQVASDSTCLSRFKTDIRTGKSAIVCGFQSRNMCRKELAGRLESCPPGSRRSSLARTKAVLNK